MHILKCVYLLDFFNKEDLLKMLPEVKLRELDTEITQRVFLLTIEENVELVLDVGMFEVEKSNIYLECHIYVLKNNVNIEEYDVVFLRKYQEYAKSLVKYVKYALTLFRDEIKKQSLPVKLYDTTLQKYKIAQQVTDFEQKLAPHSPSKSSI